MTKNLKITGLISNNYLIFLFFKEVLLKMTKGKQKRIPIHSCTFIFKFKNDEDLYEMLLVLSIVFIYFSLLFYDYTRIKNKALSYGIICRSLGRDLQTIGVSNCKSRNLGIVSRFLPENLRAKYKAYHSKKLYTGRLSFEEFINFINELGLKKTGIAGKALSPNFNYDKLRKNDYQELTSEEYYDLIENKKGTEVRIPVWCGRYKHTPWEGILSNLLQGKWCRKCADEKKITFSLERLKEIARTRGREETGVEGMILDSQDGEKELTQDTYDRLTYKKTPGKTDF